MRPRQKADSPAPSRPQTRKAIPNKALIATPDQQRKANRLLDTLAQRVAATGWQPFNPEKPRSWPEWRQPIPAFRRTWRGSLRSPVPPGQPITSPAGKRKTMTNQDDAGLSEAALANLRPVTLAKRARVVAGLSQGAFTDTYGIPIGILRDWENRRSEPDATAAAYLTAITNDPVAVANAYRQSAAWEASPETIERGGVRYVMVREDEYLRLRAAEEDLEDVRLYDEAKAKPSEFIPLELTERMLNGESPIRVYREYRGFTQDQLAEQARISKPFLSQSPFD